MNISRICSISPLKYAGLMAEMISGAIKFVLYEKRTFKEKVKNGLKSILTAKPVGANEIKLFSEDQKQRLINQLRLREQEFLVSVILPTWNRAGIIEEAISSVLSQTYENWELLIIDDGSDDDTGTILEKIVRSDSRVKYHLIKHAGVAEARNFGLRHSKGELIAYIDSDNTWDQDYLLVMTHATLDKDCCAYCALRIVDHAENKIKACRKNAFDIQQLKESNYIDLNVFVHKRDLYIELGGFDTSLKRWVDWDLILRYTDRYSPSAVPIALCNYNNRKNLSRISSQESSSYEMVVRNKHLIDWVQLEKNIDKRKRNHVTIVIPIFNQALLTENCIHSIFRETKGFSFDVLIVDNRSTFLTKATIWNLERIYEQVSHIENSNNYFFALGCNLGVAASIGEFVVLLNNDTVVTEGWLNPLIDPLKEDPSVGIIGPQLLYPDMSLQAGGMVFSEYSKIPYHIYAGFADDDPAINKQRYFQALTGACFAMRAMDFIRLRGFDPIFQNGCEDIDMCFRLRDHLDKNLLYNPQSIILHYEGKTKGRGNAINHNRKTFVARWGQNIIPDDLQYYKQDGYIVKNYIKRDNYSPQESIYKPILESE